MGQNHISIVENGENHISIVQDDPTKVMVGSL